MTSPIAGKTTLAHSLTTRAAAVSFSKLLNISSLPQPKVCPNTKGSSMKSKNEESPPKPAKAPTVRGR